MNDHTKGTIGLVSRIFKSAIILCWVGVLSFGFLLLVMKII